MGILAETENITAARFDISENIYLRALLLTLEVSQ